MQPNFHCSPLSCRPKSQRVGKAGTWVMENMGLRAMLIGSRCLYQTSALAQPKQAGRCDSWTRAAPAFHHGSALTERSLSVQYRIITAYAVTARLIMGLRTPRQRVVSLTNRPQSDDWISTFRNPYAVYLSILRMTVTVPRLASETAAARFVTRKIPSSNPAGSPDNGNNRRGDHLPCRPPACGHIRPLNQRN